MFISKGANGEIILNKNVKSDVEGISYVKWCRDKYIINKKIL